MSFLDFWPKNNTDGTITISASDVTRNDLVDTPIKHGNTSVEAGYATLFVELVGNASDTATISCGLYVSGQIGGARYFSCEDDSGTTTFAVANVKGGSAIIVIALNRQSWWTLEEGLIPAVTKIGTNGALTVNWRMLQR